MAKSPPLPTSSSTPTRLDECIGLESMFYWETTVIFILAQILPPFFRSCKGNQTYHNGKSDQLNQFLCTLNQNERFTFYGSILFGIHLQVCLQGLSRESEIFWTLVLFVINCQLWHWLWGVEAIWCWSMKIRQFTFKQSVEIFPDLLEVEDGRPSPPDKGSSHPDKMLPQRYPQVITYIAVSSINNPYLQSLLQMYLSGHTLSLYYSFQASTMHHLLQIHSSCDMASRWSSQPWILSLLQVTILILTYIATGLCLHSYVKHILL